MKKRPKQPTIPAEQPETIRRRIASLLTTEPLSAREISALAHIPEREVIDHLSHIRATLHEEGTRLRVTPASCKTCGFEFQKRERLTRPGRCPVCRGEQIREPRYAIS